MQARVLIVEDVREMAELIRLYLEREGMTCRTAESAEEAACLMNGSPFDLIVLDLNLPGMDGFQFLQRVRRESSVPVLIVSARNSDEDVVLGLGIGADEFVTKPFSPKALTARVRAILRRAYDMRGGDRRLLRFGPYTLDVEGYLLRRGSQRVPLSARELEVLSYLARNPGKALSPESIYRAVWKNEYGDLTAIAVYVQRLRRKIEADPSRPQFIETVHGKGYRFNPRGERTASGEEK